MLYFVTVAHFFIPHFKTLSWWFDHTQTHRTFYSLLVLYMDRLHLCLGALCSQLFLLQQRRLRVCAGLDSIGAGDDDTVPGDAFICVEHVNECHLWDNEWYWDY